MNKRLGDYIHPIDNRNKDGSINSLLGINVEKHYMPSVANVSGTDLSKYKIISKGQFSCNVMHVGRDERLPVALYEDEEPAIVSPAYKVFEINDPGELLPEYLMMAFRRPEFDRYTGYICDSSIRGGLDWDRFCDIEIPIPDPTTQKKYVAAYNALLKNQLTYASSLEDLQLISDGFMESLAKTHGTEELGGYIQQSDKRNYELGLKNLLGISVNKVFIRSKANQNGLSLSGYKVVEPGQFAYVTVTSRNGDKLSIALREGLAGVVSSTYVVFEVSDKTKLLPEFLYLWFKRSEFDRYVRFNSWGSARETFDWSEMCRVKLPIPSIETQRSIVAIHHTLENRKRLNDQLKNNIKLISPILIRGVVDEFAGAVA